MPNNLTKLSIRALVIMVSAALTLTCIAQPNNIRRSRASEGNSLKDRYNAAVCSIALITTEAGTGTGFFVNDKGDMVTAAHVVSSKTYAFQGDKVVFSVAVATSLQVTPHGEKIVTLPSSSVDVSGEEFDSDLAFIHTGLKPPCWIPLSKTSTTSTGDHLISIGFPGFDNGNAILYEGFLSGRFKRPQIAVANVDGKAIFPGYEVMKVQMPITSGASGSPVIDDSGHVVSVISEIPIIWTQELNAIAQAGGRPSGVTLSGFDTVKILGQLALVVREFESPGSGYAVPTSYLSPKRGSTDADPNGRH